MNFTSLSSILGSSKKKTTNTPTTYHIVKPLCKGVYEDDFGHGCSSIQANGHIKVVVPRERLSDEGDEDGDDENGDKAGEPADESDGESAQEVPRVVGIYAREQSNVTSASNSTPRPARAKGANRKAKNALL